MKQVLKASTFFAGTALSLILATTPAFAQSAPADDSATADAPSDAEIVVTGTSIRGAPPVGSQLIQVDQEAIQDAGVQSTATLFATIPQLTSFGSVPRPSNSGANPTNPPALRNLPASATLSLLNGHRLVGQGTITTVADPSAIPLAAIQRVEVLADGASSIYGSDAVAGVINVILRNDYNGVDATGAVGLADGYTQYNLGLVAGKSWDSGSLLIGGQYFQNSHLVGAERSFVQTDLRSVGGPDARSTFALTPNVTANGTSYNFNNGVFTPGALTYNDRQDESLVPASKRWSFIANFRQELGENVTLFADANYGQIDTDYLIAQQTATFTITNANPFFRPAAPGVTSETVNYRFVNEEGRSQTNVNRTRYYGGSFGADFELGSNWNGKAFANYGHSFSRVRQGKGRLLDPVAFAAAVASTNTATAFDPFTGRTSQSTLDAIFGGQNNPESTQQLFQAAANINGSLFQLPGGDVKLAAGGEYLWQKYDGVIPSGTRTAPTFLAAAGTREVKSAFAELLVPVFSADNAIPLFQELTLNAAVRYDDYSDFGSTTNPKFGLNWSPVEGLKIRGNYSESFHAPQLSDLFATDTRSQFIPGIYLPNFLTPVPPAAYQILLLAGGNPNLQPETAKTYSVGFDFEPVFAPRLRLSGTYFNIKYSNTISFPLGAFTNPILEARYVTYNPTQAQIDAAVAQTPVTLGVPIAPADLDLIVDLRRANLGATNLSGLDFGASYAFGTESAGEFLLALNGTYYLKHKSQPAPGTPFIDNIAMGATPIAEWRARGQLGWNLDDFGANIFVNHTSKFNNVGAVPIQRVGSFTTVDANISYTINNGPFGGKITLQLDAQNLFDQEPPQARSVPGFIQDLANPIGRLVQLTARVQF